MTLLDDDAEAFDMTAQPLPPRVPAKDPQAIFEPDSTLVAAAFSWLQANDPDEIRQQDVWAGLGMPAHVWTGAHGSRIIDALIQSGRWFSADPATGRYAWRRRAPL